MERVFFGSYHSFTVLTLIITIVIAIYLGYLLWSLVRQRGGAMTLSRRLWGRSGLYLKKARTGARQRIDRLFVRRSSKIRLQMGLINVSDPNLEEEENFTVGIKLKNGEVAQVKLDDFHEFMQDNRDQIATQQSKSKKPKGPRRGDLTEWDLIR